MLRLLRLCIGRDWLVERAVAGSRWKGRWWKAELTWRDDLLEAGNDGLSASHHCIYVPNSSAGVNHGIEQDGRVAVLTVYSAVTLKETFYWSSLDLFI